MQTCNPCWKKKNLSQKQITVELIDHKYTRTYTVALSQFDNSSVKKKSHWVMLPHSWPVGIPVPYQSVRVARDN